MCLLAITSLLFTARSWPKILCSMPMLTKPVSKSQCLKALVACLQLGRFDISHKIVYAPLTRCRAIDSIPHPNAAIYYSQRATKGKPTVHQHNVSTTAVQTTFTACHTSCAHQTMTLQVGSC